MAVTDTNQRWAPSGQRKGLHQALTSQEKGSGSLTSSALKARVAGGGTGRGDNVCVGDRGGGASSGDAASGHLPRRGGPCVTA